MFSLIIDTSTERGCIAFFQENQLVFEKHFPFGLNNSKYLVPCIEEGLQSLERKPQELDYISVGVGPGSYTGIRIGVITAKTMVFALSKPLITFCSLAAFLPKQKGTFAVILDAKIGGAYVLRGKKVMERHIEIENFPQIIALNELPAHLSSTEVLVTPHMSVIKKKLEDLCPEQSWCWEEAMPDPIRLHTLSAAKFNLQQFADPFQTEILYLRKTQAEIEKENR